MDYFVSIEDTNYFGWQTELLIQSFKDLGLEDNLVIGIAVHAEPKLPQYNKLLKKHAKRFIHPNIGRQHECVGLNRPYAIATALSLGHLKMPFALLHADMVLNAPLPEPTAPNSIAFNPEFIDPLVLKNIEPYVPAVMQVKGLIAPPALPLGSVLVFNNVAPFFFNRVYQRAMQVMSETSKDWDVEKGAWLLTCYEYLGVYQFVAETYACNMTDSHNKTAIVHYKHGTTPYFNKLYYMYDGFSMMTVGNTDPYAIIKQQAPVAATKAVQKIVTEVEAIPIEPEEPQVA